MTPPQIIEVDAVADARGKKIVATVLTASEEMAETAAETEANFSIRLPGKDKRLGTADDVASAPTLAEYDPATRSIRLTLAKTPKVGSFFQVFASGAAGGLADVAGNLLDGNGDGTAGDDFVINTASGAKLKYLDADGDKVSLQLVGGGTIRLSQGVDDPAPGMKILNPVAGVTTLRGTMKPNKRGGDGMAPLAFLIGGEALVNQLPAAFVVDTAPPGAPIGLSLTEATDSGLSNSDAVTNVTSPMIRGDAETGSIVRLYLNGVQVGQTTASSPWQIAVGPLADGQHTFTATASNAGGNESLPSAPLIVTIDTTAPIVPMFDLDPATDTAPTGDGITQVEIVTLLGQTAAGMNVRLVETGATTTAETSRLATCRSRPATTPSRFARLTQPETRGTSRGKSRDSVRVRLCSKKAATLSFRRPHGSSWAKRLGPGRSPSTCWPTSTGQTKPPRSRTRCLFIWSIRTTQAKPYWTAARRARACCSWRAIRSSSRRVGYDSTAQPRRST